MEIKLVQYFALRSVAIKDPLSAKFISAKLMFSMSKPHKFRFLENWHHMVVGNLKLLSSWAPEDSAFHKYMLVNEVEVYIYCQDLL
jgi:hypothetical protein